MTWLAETPDPLVQAHIAMLPRLQAEESLLAVKRAQIGSGLLEAAQQRSTFAAWEQLASPTPEKPARRGNPDVLLQHGFRVIRIPKKRPEKT